MKRKISNKIILLLMLCIGALLVAVPFIWMIFSSFKTIDEFYLLPPKIFPKKFILDNYIELFKKGNFGLYYFNSIFVTVVQVIFNIFIVTMAGYGFAKYNFKGKKVLFMVILSTTMVPWVATIIPLYIMAYKANLVNTYAGLIIPGLADAFAIFLAKNFMETIPTALIEAARIDGAGEFKIFRKLVLPLVKPVIAVITINKFIGSWNAFQWPLLIVGSDKIRTLPLAVAKFSSQYYDAYNLKMAAACLAIIPVLAVYIAFQKYFVTGISLSGVKE
ncbi:carbohydrate ABC transporter permease [Clostridium swellfunianum]|uniref:carbohydrate ABC transporter permease n=1 Tax=Clostridium swellfunianum TaxID=1367462 RepID=UPI002030C3F2|nr:carbohydrate ABC transporter permease [Clostridium swellfunianum]